MNEGKWDIAGAVTFVNDKTQAGLEALGDFMVDKVREAIATPYPPPSAPGDAPHLRTGTLQASIDWQMDGNELYIGSLLDYALYLELGTSRMEARPFLYPTITANSKEGAAVFFAAAEAV